MLYLLHMNKLISNSIQTLQNAPFQDTPKPTREVFEQWKNSKLYIPILAIIAFVGGYFSFYLIAKIESLVINLNTLEQIDNVGAFLKMAAIEQVFLGAVAFISFLVGRRYYFPLILYAGYLTAYVVVIYKYKYYIEYNYYSDMSLRMFLSYLNPVFIAALTCGILAIGLRYGKKTGLILAILINIVITVSYNHYATTTADFSGFPFAKEFQEL